METVLKETKNKSHKEFEKLLTEDLGSRKFKEGEMLHIQRYGMRD